MLACVFFKRRGRLLGSHLTDRLLSEGHRSLVWTTFTGDIANIQHLAGNSNFRLMRQDVSLHIEVEEKLDYVMHFASPASPNPASALGYPNLPIQTLKAGASALNTLGLAKRHGAKYLLASTSEVYGDPRCIRKTKPIGKLRSSRPALRI